jgi:CheY-like chemotaxis protein
VNTKTIVLADDDADLVKLLTERCTRQGYSVVGVGNALDAINVVHRVVPDLVCIDVNMPSGSGLSVCEMMASDERLRLIPVVVLTGEPSQQTIRRCHNLMVYYVEKSVDVWSRLEPLFGELLDTPAEPAQRAKPAAKPAGEDLLDAVFTMLGSDAEQPERNGSSNMRAESPIDSDDDPPWVLTIDDDPDFSEALKCRLEACGVAVARAFSGMEGYRLAFTRPASAILLDYNMPNGQGDYILGRLSDNPVTRNIPVIIVTGVRDKALERKMYGLGAKCFLTKPVKFETLRDELANHIEILDVSA